MDTAGSFMERRKAKRETRHEKLQRMVFGEPKIGAPEDGMPESTYASEILRDTLEEVGIPEDKYRWIIPLPGVSRTVKVSDLGDYCDTLPEEKVIEACKVPEEWSTDDPVTEMVGRLYTLAEAAAKAGFGDVHVPLGEDGQPIPPEPGPFEVGKKYETIGKEVGKKYEVAGELGEKIGKDIGKKYETIGRDIGKKYEKIGDTGKKITKKVEGYGKGIGKDMERKIKQMNKKYETIGDKFKKFGLTAVKGKCVKAPLIGECLADIECEVVDYIEGHGIFILDGVQAWIDPKRKERRMLHANGDGTFIVDGRILNLRKFMADKIPAGV